MKTALIFPREPRALPVYPNVDWLCLEAEGK